MSDESKEVAAANKSQADDSGEREDSDSFMMDLHDNEDLLTNDKGLPEHSNQRNQRMRALKPMHLAEKRRKRGMGFPLMALAGALALSYMVPGILKFLGIDKSSAAPAPIVKNLPVCHKGTVVITDAAFGYARETALLLADQGMHVLAGVRDEAEERSFVFDERKGLEPFRLDLTEPNDVAKLMYRLRFITAELERPLYGVVINTADSSLDAALGNDPGLFTNPPSQSQLLTRLDKIGPDPSPFNSSQLQRISEEVTNVPRLDHDFRLHLQGQIRLIQASLDVFTKALSIHENVLPTRTCSIDASTGLCNPSDDSAAGSMEADALAADQVKKGKLGSRRKRGAKFEEDAQLCKYGATGRLLFMSLDTALVGLDDRNPGAPRTDRLGRKMNSTYALCGTPCAMNAALDSYASQLDNTLWPSKFMVSRMSVTSKAYRDSRESKGGETVSHKADSISGERKWIDLKGSSSNAEENSPGSKERKFKKRMRNNPVIIDEKYSLEANQAAHAILSSKPRQFYEEHKKGATLKLRKKFLGL